MLYSKFTIWSDIWSWRSNSRRQNPWMMHFYCWFRNPLPFLNKWYLSININWITINWYFFIDWYFLIEWHIPKYRDIIINWNVLVNRNVLINFDFLLYWNFLIYGHFLIYCDLLILRNNDWDFFCHNLGRFFYFSNNLLHNFNWFDDFSNNITRHFHYFWYLFVLNLLYNFLLPLSLEQFIILNL